MKKEKNIYKLLWRIAFIVGIVVTFLLYGGTYIYDDIKNLYLLPLCYTISMLMVKCYYNDEDMGIAVSIIEITKVARFIVLPLVYVLSDQIIGYIGRDLRYDYHEKAVILMCYEMLAVSLVMLWYHRKYYKKRLYRFTEPEIKFKPSQTVYLFGILWLLLVLGVGSFREQLLNFSINEQVAAGPQTEDNSNNILNIIFQFGKIYIFAILLSLSRSGNGKPANVWVILLASIFFISSNWNDGGHSISRWGMIVAALLSIYALYCYFPQKKKTILAGGTVAVFGLVAMGTLLKMSTWDYSITDANEVAGSIFATDMFDAYFQGVYGVSNGLSTVDTYGNVIGFKNFLSELFYHFPFAVRIFGLAGHTWAEYYYKMGIEDTSKICPSLIQSDFYFGEIGSPLFSCFSVFLALWFTDKMRREGDFTVRLLYVYGIFWLSLFNCINFTIVEAHIWFAIIGIWVCKLTNPTKRKSVRPSVINKQTTTLEFEQQKE